MACTQTDQFRVNLCQPDRHETNDIEFAKHLFAEMIRPRETVIK